MNNNRKRVSYSDLEQNNSISRYVSSTRDSVCEIDDSQDESQPFLFDPNDPKYLCLCGHAHSVTGVRLVTYLMIITLFADAYELLVTYYFSSEITRTIQSINGTLSSIVNNLNEEEVITNFMTMWGGLFVICCIFISMRYKKPAFLLPYLVIQIIGLVSVTMLGAMNFLMAVSDEYRDDLQIHVFNFYLPLQNTPNQTFICIIKFGACVFLFGFQVWLAMITLSCWQYLRDIHLPHAQIEEVAANAVFKGLRRSVSAEDINDKKMRRRVAEVRSVSVCLDKHPILTV